MKLLPSLIASLAFLTSLEISADIVVNPILPSGTQYRLAFITYGARDASVDNIDVYNAFVTGEAQGASALSALSTTWSVIGSTPTVDAKANTGTAPSLSTGVPIYNLAGERIASDNADLWDGQIENAIDVDQFGNVWFGRVVLTGSNPDGSQKADRQFSGPNSFRVGYGYSDQTSSGWIDANDYQGTLAARQFYAISGTLTAIPEPTTLTLVGMMGFVAVAVRRFRM